MLSSGLRPLGLGGLGLTWAVSEDEHWADSIRHVELSSAEDNVRAGKAEASSDRKVRDRRAEKRCDSSKSARRQRARGFLDAVHDRRPDDAERAKVTRVVRTARAVRIRWRRGESVAWNARFEVKVLPARQPEASIDEAVRRGNRMRTDVWA